MSQQNPYAIRDDNVAVIDAPADARAMFLQKTYTLVLAGVFVFAATLFLSGPGMPLHSMAMAVGLNWIATMLIYFGGFILVKMLARTAMGLPLFFAFAFGFGLITAPLVVFIAGTENGGTIIGQASLITALLFTGLTAYVFKSGRDFAFLGGILFTLMIGMIGVVIAGMIFGFGIGIWFSYLGAALFSGYILYDTSNIMKRYPTTAHVSAALELFTDVVILFWYILQIVWSLYGRD